MKKTIIYLLLAVFLAIVLQPNLGNTLKKGNDRVPENTETGYPATNDSMELKADVSNITICIDAENTDDVDDKESEDINLQIAKSIGNKLRDAGYKVVYTREDNSSMTSEQRMAIAKQSKADYLLSVSTNHDTNRMQKGYSIMTQNNKQLIELSEEITAQLDTINFSEFQGLDSDHYDNFPILTNKDIPSILLEIGYITNEEDITKLKDETYQEKIGDAIAKSYVKIIK
ncbi:MAG: N-acetylmuramoyl-L-alanine amidase [Erysipelotrichaceae bacterium]|jgi:N-acetylmuramoyl-L-alanine amidase|nr:N-acetylmuramoyl-L-alanine amidase [Erysipelotrichaceae bacterium]